MVRVIRVRRATPAGALVLAVILVPPAHADLIDNEFLAALSNADIPYSAPVRTVALGHSICPMLVGPQQSFDSVVSTLADNTGMPTDMSGKFTLLAIGSYCPAMLAPLLPLHLQA